jgi:hypothetical protein
MNTENVSKEHKGNDVNHANYVLAHVNVMKVIHDLNMAIIFSDLIPEKTCIDFADIMNKVLTKHNLLTEYQNYVKRFAELPPSF